MKAGLTPQQHSLKMYRITGWAKFEVHQRKGQFWSYVNKENLSSCAEQRTTVQFIQWPCSTWHADCALQEAAGCLFCILQADCIQSDKGQNVLWFIFFWLTPNGPSGLHEHTVCVGVGLLTHFIVHLFAPLGWIFPTYGSRTLWDAVVYDGACKYWLCIPVWMQSSTLWVYICCENLISLLQP